MAVASGLTLIHACNAELTDTTTSCVLTSTDAGKELLLTGAGEYVEGSGSIGLDVDVETHTITFTPTASLNLSGQSIWIWMALLTPTYMDTWANGGISCTLSDGTNTSTWYLAGNDSGIGSAFTRHVFSTGSTPDAVSGTLSLTAVTTIAFSYVGQIKSKLSENWVFDHLAYAADGVGITVTGGTSGTPETLDDIVGDDITLGAGILSKVSGVFYLNGPVEFGDNSGTGATYFKDANQLLASISHYRTFTTTNRTSAESLVSSSHNAITVVGNTTGVTSFVFGNKTGDLGYGGCQVKTGGNRRITLTCTDTNVDIFKIYGSNFIDCGTISLPPASGTDREVISTSFNGCNQIDPDSCIFDTIVIADTADSLTGGLLVDSAGTANMGNITFISGGTGHGVYLTSGGSKNWDNFKYSGYGGTPGSNLVSSSGSTDAMVYNNSGTLATYNVTGGGDNPSVRNGAGATTQVNANVSITYNTLVNGSEVRAYLAGTSTPVDGVESVTGNAFTWSVGSGVSMDIKIFGPIPTPPSPPAIAYNNIIQKGVSFTSDTTVGITQTVNRNYRDPA